VAERAGVSIKTASNVLNNRPYVKASTRERVEAAMAELRYRPNLSARSLKHGRAGFLALAVPAMDSPYFAELAARVTEEAAALGFIVLLDVTGGDADAERAVLQGMRSHVIDGVLFSPLALSAVELGRRADRLPMVLLGERPVPPGFDHVAVNSVEAARAATDHLVAQGRRRIAAIGRENVRGTASERLRGYRQALKAAGLPYDAELVVKVPHFERADGHAAMRHLLQSREPPDGVFCFNDLMAIGALRACTEAGVKVPADIAIVGFDDIPETRYSNPTITTISPDLTGLAHQALDLLDRRIAGDTSPAQDVQVGWQLVARETTLGVPHRPRLLPPRSQ
jgi:DNA-binding LacI/PurR family transcriptional regulator